MAQMKVVDGHFELLTPIVPSTEDQVISLGTQNSFVDKDIQIEVSAVTPASGATLAITDKISTALEMGTASAGVYQPTASLTGKMVAETPGWIDDTTGLTATDSSVIVGTVNQSTLKNGTTTIASGSNITPAVSDDQTINISEGYNTARTVVVKSMSSADTQKATVASGNATIDTVTFTYDSTDENFDIGGTASIPAPTVSTAGFISSTAGTKTAGTATVATTVNTVKVGATVTGDGKVTPVIARTAKPNDDTWVDAASGAVTTTKPNSGAYVRVDAPQIDKTASVEGKVSAAGYGDITHFQKDSATTVTAGSNAAASAYVPITAGTVSSGTANIDSVNIDYNSTGGNFDVTGSANIPAPTASTAGYVGNGVGTLSGATDGATVDASIAKIGIAANLSGTGTKKPVIAKNSATNIDASAATTTQPSSGFYVAVASPANTGTVQATATVTSAGYGTTTSGQYTTTPSSELTVGAAASDTTYIPVSAGSLANAATSGQSYTDISSTGPILISGDYLYINKGYFANSKVSLARLVPDAASINLASDKMLDGFSAYNNDGVLITGTIPTYDGSYTIA